MGSAYQQDQSFKVPTCRTAGCNRPTWNGQPGEYCSRSCRNAALATPNPAVYGQQMAPTTPTCRTASCNRPTWNGQPGEYCSRSCRNAALAAPSPVVQAPDVDEAQVPEPWWSQIWASMCLFLGGCCGRQKLSPLAIPFLCGGAGQAQTGPMPDAGIIAFYFPGRNTPADDRCEATFLGNFYPRRLQIQSNRDASVASFRNAEAAFQSLKYWHCKELFTELTAEEAFRLSRQLGQPDMTYGSYGSNWTAMFHVLQQKFQDQELREWLLGTGDAFLLEHNPVQGRDMVWSDNHDGSGKNWLGLQLMLLRDQIRGEERWSTWLKQHVNTSTGQLLGNIWSDLVKSATRATVSALS